jgi:hypothetical protein
MQEKERESERRFLSVNNLIVDTLIYREYLSKIMDEISFFRLCGVMGTSMGLH